MSAGKNLFGYRMIYIYFEAKRVILVINHIILNISKTFRQNRKWMYDTKEEDGVSGTLISNPNIITAR